MRPQKIFLSVMPFLLTLQLLLAACAPPAAPGAAPAASSPAQPQAAPAAAQPAEEVARPAQDDSGIILDQILVYGNRDQIDKVVADFPLQAVGEPVDLGFLTENWEMRLYQITDGEPSDALAEKLNETAKGMDVDVHAEPNVEISPPMKPGGGVHGSPGGPPLPGPETGSTEYWAWEKQGINLGKPAVKGSGVTVGVFDTCPEMQPTWVTSVTPFVSQTPGDYAEHGASVADQINQMAPDAQIKLYCVLNNSGTGELSSLIRALVWFMRDHPNKKQARAVINLSLEVKVTNKPSLLDGVLDAAHRLQFVTVAAAGNDSDAQTVQRMDYPASYTKVIGVAGSDYKRNRAEFSNQGKVAAPAGQRRYTEEETSPPCTPDTEIYIITRASKAGYLCWQGTSFATAFVSGEAALLLSKKPKASAQEIFDRIYGMAENPAGDGNLGSGIINVTNALNGW